ncbi:hypothetical protein D9756_009046 [Leucocoprinus leucothites]|uniref:G domain-containing protein n=1 Tax=Leucocoprinus leucothites TaxID=201217 RepID=A0A8H5CXW3_9AGAR|nr:hypothetical protein D9756_009046 [Leucoagaricus leucothites]
MPAPSGSSPGPLQPSRVLNVEENVTYPETFEVVHSRHLKESDTVIILIGLVGTGKTAFISEVLGQDVGIGSRLARETAEVRGYRFRLPRMDEDLVLVDTPGFEDHSDDYEILETIANWLEQMYLRKVRFSGILLLHRITDNLARPVVWKHLQSFENIYETQLFSRVLFVTTMWNDRTDKVFVQRERELVSIFWGYMINQGARTIRFQKVTHAAALRVIRFLQEDRGEPPLEPKPGRIPELIRELRWRKNGAGSQSTGIVQVAKHGLHESLESAHRKLGQFLKFLEGKSS